MTKSIYFYYAAFIDAYNYSSQQALKYDFKVYLHYEVRLDQSWGSPDFILIIFVKLFLSTAGNKTHIGGCTK